MVVYYNTLISICAPLQKFRDRYPPKKDGGCAHFAAGEAVPTLKGISVRASGVTLCEHDYIWCATDIAATEAYS